MKASSSLSTPSAITTMMTKRTRFARSARRRLKNACLERNERKTLRQLLTKSPTPRLHHQQRQEQKVVKRLLLITKQLQSVSTPSPQRLARLHQVVLLLSKLPSRPKAPNSTTAPQQLMQHAEISWTNLRAFPSNLLLNPQSLASIRLISTPSLRNKQLSHHWIPH